MAFVELLDDVRMSRLTDRAQLRWYQINLLAGECDAAGALVAGERAMDATDIAWRLRAPADDIQTDLEQLVAAELLELADGIYNLPDFAEQQGPTQDEKRAQWRARQAAKRERARAKKRAQAAALAAGSNGNGSSSKSVTGDSPVNHANVTPTEERRGGGEEERKEEEEEENGPPPTPEGDDNSDLINELLSTFIDAAGLESSLMDLADAKEQIRVHWVPIGITSADVEQAVDELLRKDKDYTLSAPRSLNNALGILIARDGKD